MNSINEQELQILKSFRDESDTLVVELGQLQMQKIIISIEEDKIKSKVKELQDKEKLFSDKLHSKYGNVSINIETGTIGKID